MEAKPIGIFDSGLGGLTVLKELREILPHEDFIYLGDTARLPYGTKSREVISNYSKTCANFLRARDIKALVVACNTATAMALPELQDAFEIPVVGVVSAGARASLDVNPDRPVLVLATESTVRSEAYLREFELLAPGTVVHQVACPLLVPLAEEGWMGHSVTHQVIESYLKDFRIQDYGSVLLGCTHYPLLQKDIEEVVPKSVPVVNGARWVALELAARLDPTLSNGRRKGNLTFLSTDRVNSTSPLLHVNFSEPVQFQVVSLN